MIVKKLLFPILIFASTSLLSQKFTDKNFKTGFFALKRAAEGDYADVKTYLDAGGDSDFQDELGIGFLHIAVSQGNKKEVQSLLAQGTNPNLATQLGITPLHIASSVPTSLNVLHFNRWMKNAPGIVKDLLEAGANPNSKTDIGATPLHICSSMIATDQDVKNLGIVMPKPIKVGKLNTVIDYFRIGMSIASLGSLYWFYTMGGGAAVATAIGTAGTALGIAGTAGIAGLVVAGLALGDLALRVIIEPPHR